MKDSRQTVVNKLTWSFVKDSKKEMLMLSSDLILNVSIESATKVTSSLTIYIFKGFQR